MARRWAVLWRTLLLAVPIAPAIGLGLTEGRLDRASSGSTSALRTTRSFIQKVDLKQTLRVCNAYPFTSALDVYTQGASVKLTGDPLPYKQCKDFSPALHVGDRIDFKVGDASAGTFTISGLPAVDAILLLVIYRHDAASTAVAFESHIFSPVSAPQVAVLDTYKGPSQSEVRIEDHVAPKPKPAADKGGNGTVAASTIRSELLRYDGVVAIDPGAYDVKLVGAADGKVKANAELVALPEESYVVIRCGVKDEDGPEYAEDVIIYPQSPAAALGTAIRGQNPSAFVVAAVAALLSATNLA